MGINTVTLSGNIGNDPEFRHLESGSSIASFSLAVGTYKQKEKGTIWVSCKAFGKTGELIRDYAKKGAAVSVSGKLDVEEWQAQDGSKKSKTVVLVNDVALPPKANNESVF